MTNLDSILKKKSRDVTLPSMVCLVKAMVFPVVMGFSSSYVWLWELDHKESWVLKNWCFWTVVLEKTFESPLDYKESQSVNPKGNQSWIYIGRTNAEAPTLWPPDVKNWLIGKDPDAGKDWSQRRRGRQRMRWLDRITYSMDMSFRKLRKLVMDRCAAACGIAKSRMQLNWTEGLIMLSISLYTF